jgi:pyrimidine deaminase RibD-like protein
VICVVSRSSNELQNDFILNSIFAGKSDHRQDLACAEVLHLSSALTMIARFTSCTWFSTVEPCNTDRVRRMTTPLEY